jgi:hypothetical protein
MLLFFSTVKTRILINPLAYLRKIISAYWTPKKTNLEKFPQLWKCQKTQILCLNVLSIPWTYSQSSVRLHTVETCTPVFIAALFTIAKLWNPPRWPPRWMNKENVMYLHNGVLFNFKEEWNYVISGRWMKLEILMLTELRLRKTNFSCSFSHVELRQECKMRTRISGMEESEGDS